MSVEDGFVASPLRLEIEREYRAAMSDMQAEVARLTASRDTANALAETTADTAIHIMSNGCPKHNRLSFDEFVAQGGDGCPVCLTADLAAANNGWNEASAARHRLLLEARQLDADLAAARAANERLAERADASRERYHEAERRAERLTAERDGLAKALRGVSKSIEAHMYLNDPPAAENMDEYDYMMKPLWEAARAALAALPTAPKEVT